MKSFTKYTLMCFIMIASVISLSSCNKEQSAVDNYAALVEEIENDANEFSEADWEGYFSKCEQLEEEMKQCNFTKEQKKELGKLRGRMAVAVGKHSGKLLKNAAEDAMEQLKSFTEGFMEGLGTSDED